MIGRKPDLLEIYTERRSGAQAQPIVVACSRLTAGLVARRSGAVEKQAIADEGIPFVRNGGVADCNLLQQTDDAFERRDDGPVEQGRLDGVATALRDHQAWKRRHRRGGLPRRLA